MSELSERFVVQRKGSQISGVLLTAIGLPWVAKALPPRFWGQPRLGPAVRVHGVAMRVRPCAGLIFTPTGMLLC